jgi:predicted RNA polymerase sigma factor
LLARLGRGTAAAEAFQRALALAAQEPERRLLRKKLAAVGASAAASNL